MDHKNPPKKQTNPKATLPTLPLIRLYFQEDSINMTSKVQEMIYLVIDKWMVTVFFTVWFCHILGEFIHHHTIFTLILVNKFSVCSTGFTLLDGRRRESAVRSRGGVCSPFCCPFSQTHRSLQWIPAVAPQLFGQTGNKLAEVTASFHSDEDEEFCLSLLRLFLWLSGRVGILQLEACGFRVFCSWHLTPSCLQLGVWMNEHVKYSNDIF